MFQAGTGTYQVLKVRGGITETRTEGSDGEGEAGEEGKQVCHGGPVHTTRSAALLGTNGWEGVNTLFLLLSTLDTSLMWPHIVIFYSVRAHILNTQTHWARTMDLPFLCILPSNCQPSGL